MKTTDNIPIDLHAQTVQERNNYLLRVLAAEEQRDAALAALREAYELISNSDVKHYISTKLGEQARVHSAINKARAVIAASQESAQ